MEITVGNGILQMKKYAKVTRCNIFPYKVSTFLDLLEIKSISQS